MIRNLTDDGASQLRIGSGVYKNGENKLRGNVEQQTAGFILRKGRVGRINSYYYFFID